MKKIVFIIWILFFYSCDSENAVDCFQRTGDIVTINAEVGDFTRILVNPNVEMILKQGDETSVIIQSGDNLIDEVSAIVKEDQLILENTNDCNFVRSFNQTKVFVTAPNITEIRSATQFDISSDGILSYPSIKLLSEDFLENTGNTTGTFHLQIDNQNLQVISNNIASYFISGKTLSLNVSFVSGTGRFEGMDLVADEVTVFHRGTNKIIVNPQISITGEIRSTGDVVAVNRPPLVEVQEFFSGRLIIQ